MMLSDVCPFVSLSDVSLYVCSYALSLIGGGIKWWCCLTSDRLSLSLTFLCMSVWRLSVTYMGPMSNVYVCVTAAEVAVWWRLRPELTGASIKHLVISERLAGLSRYGWTRSSVPARNSHWWSVFTPTGVQPTVDTRRTPGVSVTQPSSPLHHLHLYSLVMVMMMMMMMMMMKLSLDSLLLTTQVTYWYRCY